MWNMSTVVSARCTLEFYKNAAALEKVLQKHAQMGVASTQCFGVMSPFSLPCQVLNHTVCGPDSPFLPTLPGVKSHCMWAWWPLSPYLARGTVTVCVGMMAPFSPPGQVLHTLSVGANVCGHDHPFLPTLPGSPPSSQSHRRRKLRGDVWFQRWPAAESPAATWASLSPSPPSPASPPCWGPPLRAPAKQRLALECLHRQESTECRLHWSEMKWGPECLCRINAQGSLLP